MLTLQLRAATILTKKNARNLFSPEC